MEVGIFYIQRLMGKKKYIYIYTRLGGGGGESDNAGEVEKMCVWYKGKKKRFNYAQCWKWNVDDIQNCEYI